jgi:uncharacterized membrane protein
MIEDFSTPPRNTAEAVIDIEKLAGLNAWGTVSYVLHLIVAVAALIPGGWFSPLLLIVALVIDLIKRGDALGTWHASHFKWRIRTVIIAAVLYAVTAPLWLLFVLPGWFAWLAISVWFLYRIVTGMIRLNKGLAMEVPA